MYLCSINSEKNIKQINITTVASNQDAIELFNKIIKKINSIYSNDYANDFINVTNINHLISPKNDFPSFDNLSFDLIITSKFINELLRNFYGIAWYHSFALTYAKNLADDGLMIISDVTDQVRYRNHFEWIPVILNKEISDFLDDNDEYCALLPIPCRNNNIRCKDCYTRIGINIATSRFSLRREFTCKIIGRKKFCNNFGTVTNAVFDTGSKKYTCTIGNANSQNVMDAFNFEIVNSYNQEKS